MSLWFKQLFTAHKNAILLYFLISCARLGRHWLLQVTFMNKQKMEGVFDILHLIPPNLRLLQRYTNDSKVGNHPTNPFPEPTTHYLVKSMSPFDTILIHLCLMAIHKALYPGRSSFERLKVLGLKEALVNVPVNFIMDRKMGRHG